MGKHGNHRSKVNFRKYTYFIATDAFNVNYVTNIVPQTEKTVDEAMDTFLHKLLLIFA